MSLPSGLNHFSFLLLNLFGWYKSSTFGLVFRNWLWMRKPFFDLVSLAAGSNNWIWWFILYTIPNYVVWLLFHCVTGRSVIFVGRTDPKKFLSIGNSNQFSFKIHWPVRPFRLCLCGRRIKGMSECSVREPSTKGQRKEVGSDTRFYVLFLKIKFQGLIERWSATSFSAGGQEAPTPLVYHELKLLTRTRSITRIHFYFYWYVQQPDLWSHISGLIQGWEPLFNPRLTRGEQVW